MSLSTTTNRKDYGVSSATNFPFDFKIFAESDLVVIRTNSAGVDSVVSSSLYTVNGVGDATGSIDYPTHDATDLALLLKREVPVTQPTVLRNQSTFYADVVEKAFDRNVMILQQHEEELGRSFTAPATGGPYTLELPALQAGYALGVNATADGLVMVANTGADQTIYNDATFTAKADLSSTATGKGASLVGYKATFTGAYDTTVNKYLANSLVNAVSDLDLDITGVADATSKVQAAITAGQSLYFPEGTYKISTLVVATAGIQIVGQGPRTILLASDTSKSLFDVRANDFHLENLTVHGSATAGGTGANNHFGIITNEAYPATGMVVRDVKFSGATSATGLNNGIKLDTACDSATIENCTFERLWGTASGWGYGFLAGKCVNVTVHNNRFFGSALKGRHAIYFSAGCKSCVASKNYINGFNFEGIALNAYGYAANQDANTDCVISENTISNCGLSLSSVVTGSIGVFGSSLGTKILGNSISGSYLSGIHLESVVTLNDPWVTATAYVRGSAKSEGGANYVCIIPHTSGTFATDLAAEKWAVDSSNTDISNNTIESSAFHGVRICGFSDGVLSNNTILSSGLAGAYYQIMLVSNGTFGSNRWDISGNNVRGALVGYSLFLDATAPIPTGVVLSGNSFPVGASGSMFLGACAVRIDGECTWETLTDPGVAGNWSPVIGNRNRVLVTNGQTNTIIDMLGAVEGQTVTLLFTNANAITFALNNAYLSGGVPFVSSAADTLTVVRRGTNWYEVGRGVN